MQWVTREHPKTDRIACPWLIRKSIDPEAKIVYVPRDQVLVYAEREGATSFDAPGARYTHRDGKCSFEVLIEEYEINDPAIALLAKVVHGAVQNVRKVALAPRRNASLPSSGVPRNWARNAAGRLARSLIGRTRSKGEPIESTTIPQRAPRTSAKAARIVWYLN
jgi:hypothetical protein